MVGSRGVLGNAPLGGSRSPQSDREMLRVGESRSSLDPRVSDTTDRRGLCGNIVITIERSGPDDSLEVISSFSTTSCLHMSQKAKPTFSYWYTYPN